MGRRSLVFKNLLVVEQKVSFAVEYVIDGRGHDLMVIAPVPTITVLSDVRGVVASLDCSNVVDYGKQRVSITAEGTVAVFSCKNHVCNNDVVRLAAPIIPELFR